MQNLHWQLLATILMRKGICREYICLLKNNNLKLKSNSTRVFSAYWRGGKKLSRNHLPSLFPWSKKKTERWILYGTDSITNISEKRKVHVLTTKMDKGPLLNIEESAEECIQDADYIPAPSFYAAETQK